MSHTRFITVLALAGVAAPATGLPAPVPLGDPGLTDVIVTTWANASTTAAVEWTEFYPGAEAFTSAVPHPALLATPLVFDQVRAACPAQLDGDDATDWVLLVHRDPTGPETIEHWEGNEIGMTQQSVLITAGPFAPIEAVSVGDFDGDTQPDILAVVDAAGDGLDVVVHFEQQGGGGWTQVDAYPIGVAGSRLVAISFGDLDGDALVDVVVVREDEQAQTSSLDHWSFDGAALVFTATLAGEPMDTHRFRALALGDIELDGDADLLVVDWFFFQTVHQVQRWEYAGGQLVLKSILEQRIPPAHVLVDVSIGAPCGPVDGAFKEPLPLVDPFDPPCLLWDVELTDATGFDAGLAGGRYIVDDVTPAGPGWALLRLFRGVQQPGAFTAVLDLEWTQAGLDHMLDTRLRLFNAADELVVEAGMLDASAVASPSAMASTPGGGAVFGRTLPSSGSGTVKIRGDGTKITASFDGQVIVMLCPDDLPADTRPNRVELLIGRSDASPFGTVSLDHFILRQDVPCPWDLDGDGIVGINDFLQLLADWGGSGVPADIDCDGNVGIQDFLALLANWGPCP